MLSLHSMAALLGPHPETYLPENLAGETPAKVVLDSRQAGQGSLFVCLRGQHNDGHDFADAAVAQGALAILAEKNPFGNKTPPLPVLGAADSGLALARLASAYRENFRGQVIGITGSAGKTSVKEALAAVLAGRGPTSRTFMNMNSRLGLPVSMLNASSEAHFWVMEAGISEDGDMDYLGQTLKPDLALLLNAGPGHLEGLKDKGVAWHKARLLAYLRPNGRALVSADYPDLLQESRALRGEDLFLFSAGKAAHYSAAYLGASGAQHGRYLARLEEITFETPAPFRGNYGAENVAAVAGAAHLLGLGAEEIRSGLAGLEPPAQRFNCASNGRLILVDDSYNANPLSVARVLENATEMAAETGGPLVLVLGELLELGEDSPAEHQRLGRLMAESGSRLIYWQGGQTEAVREGLRQGLFQGTFTPLKGLEDFQAAMPALRSHLEQGRTETPRGVVLFKASRGNRLELLAELFRERYFSASSA
ncbi:MAG: UDP-N-acetylmuramoyl-tripeptide--D-alanyl-D-alanine ligase [Desulfovibrionaceae bacterium]|nr:UDP-N-acetylmuramoyl-tripeptide--D-alanyl-D-alanine ligase [Desulfovibrionaceae bacterium]